MARLTAATERNGISAKLADAEEPATTDQVRTVQVPGKDHDSEGRGQEETTNAKRVANAERGQELLRMGLGEPGAAADD